MNRAWDEDEPTPEESRRISRRKVLGRFAVGIGAASALLAAETFVREPSWLEVVRQNVPIRGLPPGFHGFKIAALADFHFGMSMPVEFARRAFRMAMDQKPDLIAIPGDFMQKGSDAEVFSLLEALEGLKAPKGVFGVYGNHDHWSNIGLLDRELKKTGLVRILINESVLLEKGGDRICLAGTDDLRTGVYKPWDALAGVDPEMPRIVLQHQPDAAEEMDPGWRVDLAISGHMHGGQIAFLRGVPGVLPSRYGTKFVHGLVQGKGHRVYVTRGVGGQLTGRPRFWCRPEVSLLTLVPESA